jgi:hypothetical protein
LSVPICHGEARIAFIHGLYAEGLGQVSHQEPGAERSIEASRAHATLGQQCIKAGALVDAMAHVLD